MNGRLQNNLPNRWTDGELNDQLENNSPIGWTGGEFNDQLENNSPKAWTMESYKVSSKIFKILQSGMITFVSKIIL